MAKVRARGTCPPGGGRQGAPVFDKRIGRGLALNLRHHALDLLNRLLAPQLNLPGSGPTWSNKVCSATFQAIPASGDFRRRGST